MLAAMQRLGVREVLVSESDLLDGALQSLMGGSGADDGGSY